MSYLLVGYLLVSYLLVSYLLVNYLLVNYLLVSYLLVSYLLVNRRRWFQDLAPVLLSYRQQLFLVNRLMTDSGHLPKKLEEPYLDPGLMQDSGWVLGPDLF